MAKQSSRKGDSPKNISRRRFIQLGAGGALLLALPKGVWSEEASQEWWFVHLSDSHNGAPERVRTLRLVLDDLMKAFPQSQFAINTGDITEHGWEEELDENLEGMQHLTSAWYNVMGNHDSRWSRSGRRAFRERYGATRWAIEHDFLSLFALDSSILVEQHGHLDPFDLAWLEGELKRLDGKAALIAFHHPPCDIKRFLDSDGDLFKLIAAHNVAGILCGHIHTIKQYEVNGTWILSSGAVMTPRSGYCVFRVRPDEMTLFDRRPLEDETREVMTIPLKREARVMPSPGDVLLASEVRGNTIRVALPAGYEADKTVLLLNGHAQEFQSESQDGKSILKIQADQVIPGHQEIEICSPEIQAKNQRRAWGTLSVQPPENVGFQWQRKMSAGVQNRPAFWEDRIMVGTNDGKLHALEAKSGKDIWTVETGPDEVISSPIIYQDRVYLGTIGQEVCVFSAAEGKLLWKSKLEGSIIATGVFAGEKDRFIIGTGAGLLYALSPETGEIQWSYQAGNLIKATPAYDGKRLYFGAWDGHFYAVDAETGKEAWKLRINTPHLSPATCNPGVLDGKVIVVSHDYATHCLNAETGERYWRWPEEGIQFAWNDPILDECKPSYSSPIFYEGVAYLGSITGHVVGFDVATGEQVFNLAVADPIFDSHPLLIQDLFYFGTTGGRFCALNLKTGVMAWEYSLGSDFIFSPPGSDGKRLAIGSLGGQMACFDIA